MIKKKSAKEEAEVLEKEPIAQTLLRDLEELTEERAQAFDHDFHLITEGIEDGEEEPKEA